MGTNSTTAEHKSHFVFHLASQPEIDPAEIHNVELQIMDEIRVAKRETRGSVLYPVEPDYTNIERARFLLLRSAVAANVLNRFDKAASNRIQEAAGQVWDGDERICRIGSMAEFTTVLGSIPLQDQLALLLKPTVSEMFQELSARSPYNQ